MVLPVCGYMENKGMNDKASENIPAMCKIRYTVNRVVLLEINNICIYIYIYTQVIVHMPVICEIKHLLTNVAL